MANFFVLVARKSLCTSSHQALICSSFYIPVLSQSVLHHLFSNSASHTTLNPHFSPLLPNLKMYISYFIHSMFLFTHTPSIVIWIAITKQMKQILNSCTLISLERIYKGNRNVQGYFQACPSRYCP